MGVGWGLVAASLGFSSCLFGFSVRVEAGPLLPARARLLFVSTQHVSTGASERGWRERTRESARERERARESARVRESARERAREREREREPERERERARERDGARERARARERDQLF